MLYIGITTETVLINEPALIRTAIEGGMDKIHIRKPGISEKQMREFIGKLDQSLFPYLVLHDCLHLAQEYILGGVHLNSRSTVPPQNFKGTVSRSCHSLEELSVNRYLDYCTLSPIFNSLSKQGYLSRFTHLQLREGHAAGVINSRTMALGGITPENISLVEEYGFGGAAVLGYLWQNATEKGVSENIKKLKRII